MRLLREDEWAALERRERWKRAGLVLAWVASVALVGVGSWHAWGWFVRLQCDCGG